LYSTVGLVGVITPGLPEIGCKNRGFCFLDYKSHESALKAMNHLHWGNVKIFGVDVVVDWAETQEDPDSDAMEKVLFFYLFWTFDA